VVNLQKVKEWLLRKITQKDVNHLEQDTIVQIQVHVGNQDIGLVELGNLNQFLTTNKIYSI
jgi:hypothetical protein